MFEVTAIVTAIAAMALVALSLPVTLRRIKVGPEIGVGDDPTLLRLIRAQGNFIEYVPLGLIVLALAEEHGTSVEWLWGIAGLLIAGRFLHVVGMLRGNTPLRGAGMLATYTSLIVGAGALVLWSL